MVRFALLLLVPLLSACEIWGGKDETTADAPAPRLAVPVQEVAGIEIGRSLPASFGM